MLVTATGFFRYHVPRSWLKPTKNLLIVFEELGGDASKISLVKRSVSSVCADAYEHHPTTENWHIESDGESTMLHQAKVHLQCTAGQSISAINFASFGTPSGTCGSFEKGTCHSPNSHTLLEKVLIQLQHLPWIINIIHVFLLHLGNHLYQYISLTNIFHRSA